MAEPIILPVLSASSQSFVKRPRDPTNPPDPVDIRNALQLTSDLLNARFFPSSIYNYSYISCSQLVDQNRATDDDIYKVALYQHQLIAVTAAHGKRPLFCETHIDPSHQQEEMPPHGLLRPCDKLWNPSAIG